MDNRGLLPVQASQTSEPKETKPTIVKAPVVGRVGICRAGSSGRGYATGSVCYCRCRRARAGGVLSQGRDWSNGEDKYDKCLSGQFVHGLLLFGVGDGAHLSWPAKTAITLKTKQSKLVNAALGTSNSLFN